MPVPSRFCLRLREAEISFGSRRLALQLTHASRARGPGAVSLGLVEVVSLACVSGLGLKLVQAGSGSPGAQRVSHRVWP